MRREHVNDRRRESVHLRDQASTLEDCTTTTPPFQPRSTVPGSGLRRGRQTVPLIRRSPGARIKCIDISMASLAQAEARVTEADLPPPRFREADLHALPFGDAFSTTPLSVVLEHLPQPAAALVELRRVVSPGGTLTVIEGDHRSPLPPRRRAARAAIRCQVDLQQAAGGTP